MDSELYTWLDALQFFLFYYRRLFLGLILLADVHLFTRWNLSRAARLPAVLLAVLALCGVVWEISILF